MALTDLKPYFITVPRPYKEGAVEVFEQAIPAQQVKSAVLTITALGVYEAALNGEKAGDVFLAPGYTYYPHNLHVQAYDVTGLLRAGENTLRVYLGQGWYCGRFTHGNKTKIYGEAPAVSWVLELAGEDGSITRYTSADASVRAVKSPYVYAGLYDGEVVYADGAPEEAVQPVPYTGALPDVLEESTVCVRLREEMPVVTVSKRGDVYMLDFGQNFAGVVTIDPAKMDGPSLRLRHGERLNVDGSLYTANLRQAKAELVYHKGADETPYTLRFSYMGFRYIELTGCDWTKGLITARAVYSDMGRTGDFRCENEMVQRLYLNQLWGQRSNYVEVPTDCPQRDERMGYTGDGQVFALTGMYNYDTEAFWLKFLKDIRYSQQDNSEGYVAPTVPAEGPAGIGFINMLGWASCDTIVPELLYWQYGSDAALRAQYESMKTFVDCEIRHMGGMLGKKDLWIAPNLGDWLAPGKDIKYMAMHNGPVSNAFIVNDLRIMAWAAEYMGEPDAAARYTAQMERTRAAYIKAFIKKGGVMKDDYQGAYVMALAYVLPKGETWDAVFANLLKKLRAEGMQTGFFATAQLLPLLAENGQSQLAFDLLLQEECPGWMYQVKRGATTIWERWDAIRPDGTVNESEQNGSNMVSFNHYAFGAVGQFYYQYILGIRPAAPGYHKIRFAPLCDPRLGGVSGSYQSRAGLIKAAWHYTADSLSIELDTPTETELILPGCPPRTVPAGHYRENLPR